MDNPDERRMKARRHWLRALVGGFVAPAGGVARAAVADEEATATAADALRQGGVVVVMRHTLAPGTFDPPGFKLGDCATQRNLSDAGRDHARRIGEWFRAQRLVPAAVRSSQWCRCRDTATLAFGAARDWPALNSVIAIREREPEQTAALRSALARVPGGRFEVWVTHQVNIGALAGESAAPGDAVVLRHDAATGRAVVVASLRIV